MRYPTLRANGLQVASGVVEAGRLQLTYCITCSSKLADPKIESPPMYKLSLPLLASLLFLCLGGCDTATESQDPATRPDEPLAESASPAVEPERPATLNSVDQFQATSEDLGPREAMPGAALYAEHCAVCHTGGVSKSPHLVWLEMMTPRAVYASMTEGVMQPQAAHLGEAERVHIAEYITRARLDSQIAAARAPVCTGGAAVFDRSRPAPKVGWGHDTRRFVDAGTAMLSAADVPNLELKWAFAFPNALRTRSQPAIAMGAVFVGSQDGTVYAFDLESGCERWSYQASAEVRTAIVLSDAKAEDGVPMAYFGDILAKLYAVNALTGELLWSIKVDDHPSATITGTPALARDRLLVPVSSLEVTAAADPAYECCSFQGKVVAVAAATGEVIWSHSSIPTPPVEASVTSAGTRVLAPSGAPVWSSPAVDYRRNLVYFGTGENYSSPADGNSDAIIAIDLDTGERAWHRQTIAGDAWNVACMFADNPNCPEENGPDLDHGSSMVLIEGEDGAVLAAGGKNGLVFGLDPDRRGTLLWSTRVGRGSIQGGVHFGMAAGDGLIYAPINDMNDTRNGDFLDPDLARPGVHALDATSGEVMWRHVQEDLCGDDRPFCDPGVSAAVTAIPGVLFAGHLDGHVRAYAAADGKVLWDFDTTQPVDAVNGLVARGGGMSGGGPAVGDGYLVVNSGYGLYFHEPGNALLVFTPGEGS